MTDWKEPPTRKVCAVCGRVLATIRHEGDPEPYYDHEYQDQPSDHVPVPVLPETAGEQAQYRCDFCNVDTTGPVWVVPARTFPMPAPLTGKYSDGDWAACEACAELICANRWDGLLRRCAATAHDRSPAISLEVTRAYLATLYSRLRRNITGPVVKA